ncbi:MAG: glycoside hydrolase family 65 protein, partial [Pseudomonadota bacterium]
EWALVYDDYDPAEEGRREALCALGNGYFVTRAAAPDSAADAVHYPGTYVAGGYNRLVSDVAGAQIENEDLVNLPNHLLLTIRIDDGDWIRGHDLGLLEYHQELDLRTGVLLRTLRLEDQRGRIIIWREQRIVSMADRNVAALAVTVTAENFSGRLTVRSGIDGNVVNAGVARYRDFDGRHLELVTTAQPHPQTVLLHTRMTQSRREIAQAARTRFFLGDLELEPDRNVETHGALVAQEAVIDVAPGDALTIEKSITLYTSAEPAISEPALEAGHKAARLGRFRELLQPHRQAWQQLWERCDLDLRTAQARGVNATLRLHVFHLLQTVSAHTSELDVGVPPRGWHGEAYRGHIFWDELFIFPYLNLRMPELTRELLRYRYRRLPAARRAAAEAGYRGAMFPWQSGSNGREESQRVHLNPASGRWLPDNSRRQRHIGAAIAYNVWQYYQVTDDQEFMYCYGVELLAEIARFWASIASYDATDDRYDIRGVMGPDEFHTAYPGQDPTAEGGLDNNAYTNVLASWVLARAMDAMALLPDQQHRHLRERLGLADDEIDGWDTISRKLRVPFHDHDIISQFEGYERLQELDWAGLRERHGNIQRLDRVLEAEGDDPNRYKASKQADALMLFYLFSADELRQIFERLGYAFDHALITRNIDYYLTRTSHGSTLSWVVHSWLLARANRAQSWSMFCNALRSDVADIQDGTTPEGIHLGAMAGTVDIMQRCYTGIETRENALHLDPSLPDELECLRTEVRYRGQVLDLVIDHETLEVSSRPFTAMPVAVVYRGHLRQISPGQTHRFRLVKPPHQRTPPGPA